MTMRGRGWCWALIALLASASEVRAVEGDAAPAAMKQTEASCGQERGCMSCRTTTDSLTMHTARAITLETAADCHGGNAKVFRAGVALPEVQSTAAPSNAAHIKRAIPKNGIIPPASSPPRTYTLLNANRPNSSAFSIQRLPRRREACGACHLRHHCGGGGSLMATTAMFWAAAALQQRHSSAQHPLIGEAYTRDGEPAKTD